MEIPDSITCVDCLQVARLMTLPSEDGWQPGDIVAYRCTGCNDRWDMVVDDDHGSESQHPFPQDAAVIREFLDGRRGLH
jgi:hypothetical protein